MVFGVIGNKFKEFFNIIVGRMPRKSRDFLRKNGNQTITNIMLRREPVMKVIDKLFSFMTFGKWDELKSKYGYDQMFHLSMIITLSDGKQYTVEKNEIINIGGAVKADTDKTEYYPVSLNDEHISLNELVEKTISQVGEDRFLDYDAFSNNCQRFIIDILTSNNIISEDIQKWVLQPVDELVKELPDYVDKVAKTATDIGGYASRFKEFLGFKKGGRVMRQKVRNRRRFGRMR